MVSSTGVLFKMSQGEKGLEKIKPGRLLSPGRQWARMKEFTETERNRWVPDGQKGQSL